MSLLAKICSAIFDFKDYKDSKTTKIRPPFFTKEYSTKCCDKLIPFEQRAVSMSPNLDKYSGKQKL